MNTDLISYIINIMFVIYFVVLFAERVQSIVRSVHRMNVLSDGLNRYMYIMSVLSLVVTLALVLIYNQYMFAGVFSRSLEIYDRINMKMLCIAAGCLLISGMIHTEYSNTGVQFVAYGALVVAIVLRTINVVRGGDVNTADMWISSAYIISLSMAIPVVYRSHMDKTTLFHTVEIFVSLILIGIFTLDMCRLFTEGGVNTFSYITLGCVAVGDTAVIMLRKKEHLNVFVLIFLILTVILWIAGKIIT